MHDSNILEDQPVAWTPTPEVIERAQLTKFMKQVGVSTWDELYAFSIADVEKFTEEVLKFLDIKFDPPYKKLLDVSDGVEFPKWFSTQRRKNAKSEPKAPLLPEEGWPQAGVAGEATGSTAGLNISTMCLDRWQTDEMKDQPAVIWEGEEGEVASYNATGQKNTYTYGELFEEVGQCAAGLRHWGFGKGDAIGIHMPMMIETVVSLLAINRIGAIAVPVFSGYGVEAISSRLNAVHARALFTCDGFPRRGKIYDSFAVASEAVSHCPTIEKLVIVGRRGDDWHAEEPLASWWSDLLTPNPAYEELNYPEPTSAEDPLIILYTSGTTGKPKGIAHTHASFPLKSAQDMAFGMDVGRGTRICWYTDIGWMMGPWLIYGALINGGTICIYDGAPDYPTPDRMWEFCAKHKVEILGIAPTLVRSLAAAENSPNAAASADNPKNSPPYEGGVAAASADGVVLSSHYKAPHERHDLSSLRAFASSGEPWNPAPWWWLFEMVGNSKLPIINYSGGTEISGGILCGNPLLPQKPCSFPAPCPGMDVDILEENGEPVGSNEVGELVIKQPWIGMARGFWQEKERYLDTYWRRFKDIWVHGDWAMRDSDGHWFILGRSDDTLKVAGKRVGPAEVEGLLVSHPQVTEAAVIGVPHEVKGTAMVAFVVLSKSSPPYEGGVDAATADGVVLAAELKQLVSKDMGKPLAPSAIHFVSALPKTRNAKVMRRVIRSAYLGEDPGDTSSLENPSAIDEIRNAGEAQ